MKGTVCHTLCMLAYLANKEILILIKIIISVTSFNKLLFNGIYGNYTYKYIIYLNVLLKYVQIIIIFNVL